jgi:hypothetical protein
MYETNLYFDDDLVDRCSVNVCIGTWNIRCRSSTRFELGETRNEGTHQDKDQDGTSRIH